MFSLGHKRKTLDFEKNSSCHRTAISISSVTGSGTAAGWKIR